MAAARLLLLGSILVLALANGQPTSRIYGGENAENAAFPHAVSVRLDHAHICGGTIISAEHILTAAHCVAEKNSAKAIDSARLSVRVGSTNQFAGGKIVDVSHVTVHPAYDDTKNDLAIITLANLLDLNDRVQYVTYGKRPADIPPEDHTVVVAGWGEQADGTSPYKLQHSTFTVASEEDCTDAFKNNDDSIICLNHSLKQGSCRGDAGNGGTHDGVLVAVSNFIVGACGARYPDVYANVVHFSDWIDSVLTEDV